MRCSTGSPTLTWRSAPGSASSAGNRAASRRFFDKYQDRILFGTDAIPLGIETPQQVFGEELYRIYYRFLETEDESFDYAPSPVPPQGRWRIYGLGLPERDPPQGLLRKCRARARVEAGRGHRSVTMRPVVRKRR